MTGPDEKLSRIREAAEALQAGTSGRMVKAEGIYLLVPEQLVDELLAAVYDENPVPGVNHRG